jgi:glucan biosynthesis protein C
MAHHAAGRLHALDGLRAFALVAGMVLHATLSFLPGYGRSGWPIIDVSPSLALALVFYLVHMFRMVLFFLLAGFFARMLVERDGVAGFIRNRAKRILVPLVAGWVVLFPLFYAIVAWVVVRSTGGPLPHIAPSLMHLWFLIVLLWIYGIALAARQVLRLCLRPFRGFRESLDRPLRGLLMSPLSTVWVAAPLAIALYLTPHWPMWFGIPTPGFVPGAAALVGYGSGFAFGWLLHREPDLLNVWERRRWISASGAAFCTLGALAIVGVRPVMAFAAPGPTTLLYAVLYATAVWQWNFAVVGFAMRWYPHRRPAVQYVVDASYWSYLVHMPIVLWLQAVVMLWPIHWLVKFSMVLAGTGILVTLSYHLLVRSTLLGAALNGGGRRHPPVRRPAEREVPAV